MSPGAQAQVLTEAFGQEGWGLTVSYSQTHLPIPLSRFTFHLLKKELGDL